MRNNKIKVLKSENEIVLVNGCKTTHIRFEDENLVRINGKAYFVDVLNDRIDGRFIPEKDTMNLYDEDCDIKYNVEDGDVF